MNLSPKPSLLVISDLIHLLLKVGGLQALLFGAILFSGNRQKILAALMFVLGVSCLLYGFNKLDTYLYWPHLIRLHWGLPLLIGPLMYFQLKKWGVPHFSWQASDAWHLGPYMLNLFILMPFFFKNGEVKIQSLDYFTAILTAGTDVYRYYYHILQAGIAVSGIYYALECLSTIKLFVQKLKQEYTSLSSMRLSSLQNLSRVLGFLSLFLLISILWTAGDVYAVVDVLLYYYLGLFLLIYLVTYQMLRQPTLLMYIEPMDLQPKMTTQKKLEDANTMERSADADRLITYLKKEKPYLNGALTATQLANSLDISRHRLSEILNTEIGKSFYELINAYRLDAFKQKIKDPDNDHFTLFSLALDAGFNSKTTFNAYFKKKMGMTPMRYKKTTREE